MSEFQKTSCGLCLQSCGLEVLVKNNHIVKVRPDRDNLRSQGYVCRKGLNIKYLQHHAQRLDRPLKRGANGFESLEWDRALDEISHKLRGILDHHGPESVALMAGGAGGCQLGGRFAGRLLFSLGSKYLYTAPPGPSPNRSASGSWVERPFFPRHAANPALFESDQ